MIGKSVFFVLLSALVLVIFIPALIIGSIGARKLEAVHEEQRLYTPTLCYVLNITDEVLPYDCDCYECDEKKCYGEHFLVEYALRNGTILFSEIHVNRITHLLPITTLQNYTCYYNANQVKDVHWSKPSARPALTMVIGSFTIGGLFLLAMLIWSIVFFVRRHTALSNPRVRFA